MSEIIDSTPIVFNDSITAEDIEETVDNVTQEIETVEIEDEPAVAVNPKKKSKANILTTLPLSRMKKICKLDPEVNLVTADAVKLITFCTERFIEQLTIGAVACAREAGRKTVNNGDVNRAIRRSFLFYMLDEALDEWPDNDSRPKSFASNNSDTNEDLLVEEPQELDVIEVDTEILEEVEIIEKDVSMENDVDEISENDDDYEVENVEQSVKDIEDF